MQPSIRLKAVVFCILSRETLLLFCYTSLSRTQSSMWNTRTKCHFQTLFHLATTWLLLWPLSPPIRVTCYPWSRHLRGPERETHSLWHTADRELFELLKHVRFSSHFLSLSFSVSLLFTLSQWYLILHSVGIGFVSGLDQSLFVSHGGGLSLPSFPSWQKHAPL